MHSDGRGPRRCIVVGTGRNFASFEHLGRQSEECASGVDRTSFCKFLDLEKGDSHGRSHRMNREFVRIDACLDYSVFSVKSVIVTRSTPCLKAISYTLLKLQMTIGCDVRTSY